jgi:hypothetical protein
MSTARTLALAMIFTCACGTSRDDARVSLASASRPNAVDTFIWFDPPPVDGDGGVVGESKDSTHRVISNLAYEIARPLPPGGVSHVSVSPTSHSGAAFLETGTGTVAVALHGQAPSSNEAERSYEVAIPGNPWRGELRIAFADDGTPRAKLVQLVQLNGTDTLAGATTTWLELEESDVGVCFTAADCASYVLPPATAGYGCTDNVCVPNVCDVFGDRVNPACTAVQTVP